MKEPNFYSKFYLGKSLSNIEYNDWDFIIFVSEITILLYVFAHFRLYIDNRCTYRQDFGHNDIN